MALILRHFFAAVSSLIVVLPYANARTESRPWCDKPKHLGYGNNRRTREKVPRGGDFCLLSGIPYIRLRLPENSYER